MYNAEAAHENARKETNACLITSAFVIWWASNAGTNTKMFLDHWCTRKHRTSAFQSVRVPSNSR